MGRWVLDGERSGTVRQEKRMVKGRKRSDLQGCEEGPVSRSRTGRGLSAHRSAWFSPGILHCSAGESGQCTETLRRQLISS